MTNEQLQQLLDEFGGHLEAKLDIGVGDEEKIVGIADVDITVEDGESILVIYADTPASK